MSVTSVDIPKTYGALLLGTMFASFLSGGTTVQTIVYLKLFPEDNSFTKGLVTAIWALDISHTALIWYGAWIFLIQYFGDTSKITTIPLCIALTIIFTAVLTLLVYFHYIQRIYQLSKGNIWICVPIVVLAMFRVGSACATSAEMIRFNTLPAFRSRYAWLFSLGLAISAVVDIIITITLFTLLYMSRSKSLSLNSVIDSLILYTFEIGSLTGAATIVAMVFWLAVTDNLIFLGLHFIISKLYANSLMASLNARLKLRQTHARSTSDGVRGTLASTSTGIDSRGPNYPQQKEDHSSVIPPERVKINVEKDVLHDDDPPTTVKFISGAGKGSTAIAPSSAV
ncbi:hypothetical protein F5887DRAFT_962847 [Amanita rubescens]|nr:hypothetical protein F5887DRAFT_962847 [Amanita rubescens]